MGMPHKVSDRPPDMIDHRTLDDKYPSSAAAILKLRFRDHVTPDFPAGPDFGPRPVIWLGLELAKAN